MIAMAPVVRATFANASKLVAQVQVLLRVVFVCQWYSSDSDPPGNRRNWLLFSVRRLIVVCELKFASQIAEFKPNIRRSTVRTVSPALTFKLTTAGGPDALSWMSST